VGLFGLFGNADATAVHALLTFEVEAEQSFFFKFKMKVIARDSYVRVSETLFRKALPAPAFQRCPGALLHFPGVPWVERATARLSGVF